MKFPPLLFVSFEDPAHRGSFSYSLTGGFRLELVTGTVFLTTEVINPFQVMRPAQQVSLNSPSAFFFAGILKLPSFCLDVCSCRIHVLLYSTCDVYMAFLPFLFPRLFSGVAPLITFLSFFLEGSRARFPYDPGSGTEPFFHLLFFPTVPREESHSHSLPSRRYRWHLGA